MKLQDGVRILKETAPVDLADLAHETIPTVAVLLQKSTDRLPLHHRRCFAFLGPAAPKPATFDLGRMQAVWQEDPKPVVRVLVDAGLLEPAGERRFHMHALLATHARTLLARLGDMPDA